MWRAFCESVGRQGRTAGLFIFAVMAMVCILPFVNSFIEHVRNRDLDTDALLFWGAIISAPLVARLSWMTIRSWRNQRSGRMSGASNSLAKPLAEVELKAARAKLGKPRC
jgi:hypothetical protein